MKKLGLLLFLGACSTLHRPEPAAPQVAVIGNLPAPLKTVYLADLIDEDWSPLPKRQGCVTHLYECRFDSQGHMIEVRSLDQSNPAFHALTEEALKSWSFQEGQGGTCHAQVIYQRGGPTRVLLVEADMAADMVSNLQKNRAALPPDVEGAGPTVLHRVKPGMPRALALKKQSGFITVHYDIDEAGVPNRFKVIDEHPAGLMEEHALRALRRWRYAPLADEPHTVRSATVTIDFLVNGSEPMVSSCDLGLRLNRAARTQAQAAR